MQKILILLCGICACAPIRCEHEINKAFDTCYQKLVAAADKFKADHDEQLYGKTLTQLGNTCNFDELSGSYRNYPVFKAINDRRMDIITALMEKFHTVYEFGAISATSLREAASESGDAEFAAALGNYVDEYISHQSCQALHDMVLVSVMASLIVVLIEFCPCYR